MEFRHPTTSECQLLSNWYLSYLGQRVSVHHLQDLLSVESEILLVAVSGSRIEGFLHATWSGGPYELLGLIVRESSRRRGLGRRALRECAKGTSRRGVDCAPGRGLKMATIAECPQRCCSWLPLAASPEPSSRSESELGSSEGSSEYSVALCSSSGRSATRTRVVSPSDPA